MARSILLADDSPTIRKIVELTFSETDIRIHAVASGTQALELLRSLRPDLVLADVVMPDPGGYEICRAVKRSPSPVPVLLLAGTFEPYDEALARECGADGHLVKPFESRTLRRRVEELLAPADSEAPTGEESAEDRAEPSGAVDENGSERAAEAEGEPAVAEDPVPAEEEALPTDEAAVDPAVVDAVAREVVRRLSDRVVREIAWDVIPDIATRIIRERIRELEREDED
jgi:DNA-binding response OmpR family regulator